MDVLIDTDPGGDDAIALMWLASLMRQGRLRIVAVSTAAGNVGSEMTYRNAAGILALCGLGEIPVGVSTCAHAPRDAAEVHGDDGLGGFADTLPEPAMPIDAAPRSDSLLAQHLQNPLSAPQLLAVAPLTNLACAEAAVPGILNRAQNLFVMGGSLGKGNITSSAEFNFFCDPASAARVLSARQQTRLVTLDTSRSLRLADRLVAKIVAGHSKHAAARFFAGLCRFMSQRDSRLSGGRSSPGFPVHDASTVAWLVYPEFFESRPCQLSIVTRDGKHVGQLREAAGPQSASCRVATRIAGDALLERMADDLKTLFS